MKKTYLLLFSLCSFIFFSSNVSAKVSVNVDVRDNSSFNIFYEMNNNTPMFQYLLNHGSGRDFVDSVVSSTVGWSPLKSYGSYGSTNWVNNYRNYAVWLKYPNDSSNGTYEIDIDLIKDNSSYIAKLYLYFDEDMNYSSYYFTTTSLSFNDSSYHKLDFSQNPFWYFNYYTGNVDYYDSSSDYVLRTFTGSHGETYNINTSGIEGFFNSLFAFFNGTLVMSSDQLFLNYYKDNLIIGKNKTLVSVAYAVMGQMSDFTGIDLSQFSSINLSSYANGVWFYPLSGTLQADDSISFYGYTTNVSNYVNGLIGILDSNGGINYDVNNVFRNNFSRANAIEQFNFAAFSNNSSLDWQHSNTTWNQYAYYFWSDKTTSDVILYYDSSVYGFARVDNSDNARIYNNLSDTYIDIVNNSSIRQHAIDELTSQHYVYHGSTDVAGNNVTCGVNGCEVVSSGGSLFGNLSDTSSNKNSIIDTAKNGISVMTSFFQNIFEGFPLIYNLIVFGLSCLIVVAVIKMVL